MLRWLRWLLISALLCAITAASVTAESQEAVKHNQAQPTKTDATNNQPGDRAAISSSQEQSHKRDNKGNWYDTFTEHLTDWLLVLFNGVLAIFTARLFYAVTGQSRHLEASVAVAERAAAAAEVSAEAAIGLQLPKLVIHGLGIYLPGQPYGNWKPFETMLKGGPVPDWFQVAVQIDNVGKTNAAVTDYCIEQIVGPNLPKAPQYSTIIPMPVGEVIRADDGYLVLHVQNRFFQITPGQRKVMDDVAFNHHLWIYGFIRFADYRGKLHEQRFCKRWTADLGFVSESDTPEEYTKGN